MRSTATRRPIHLKRLKTLVAHLRFGKMAHPEFDFRHYNVFLESPLANANGRDVCATSGCAIGETPVIWPKLFKWKGNSVVLRKGSSGYSGADHCKFFHLSELEYEKLFTPAWVEGQISEGYLPCSATKEEVADHVEKFIRHQWMRVTGEKYVAPKAPAQV